MSSCQKTPANGVQEGVQVELSLLNTIQTNYMFVCLESMNLYCGFVAALTQQAVQANTLFRWVATEQHKSIKEMAENQSKPAINYMLMTQE